MTGLRGTRAYYEIAIEDLRRQLGQALGRDSDHLFGFELASPGRRRGRALLVEFQKTGIRSHEHELFTTGLTNGGRLVGSPIGPDAWAAFVGTRLDIAGSEWWPWIEVGRWSSDRHVFPAAPGGGPGRRRWKSTGGRAFDRARPGA